MNIIQSDISEVFWSQTAEKNFNLETLASDIDVEAAVIGAGLTGLSAALHLQQRGCETAVVEAMEPGWGASGRNNGQVIPTMTAIEPAQLEDRFGLAGARLAVLIGASAEYLFNLIVKEDIFEAEAEQTGWLQPAHREDRLILSRRRVEGWRNYGEPLRYVGRDEMVSRLGSTAWHGGLLANTGGHINPMGFVRGLTRININRGCKIYSKTPIKLIERSGPKWILTATSGKRISARRIILATNSYTGLMASTLWPKLSKTIIPILSWQVCSGPIDKRLREYILPGREAVSDTRGDLRFFRYDCRNRIITGAAVLPRWNQREHVISKAKQNLIAAYPKLENLEITNIWSGVIGMTRDRFPYITRLGDNAWAWGGGNGRGVALSVALGAELAKVVSGDDYENLALPITELRPVPAHKYVSSLAPFYLTWLRRKDKKPIKITKIK